MTVTINSHQFTSKQKIIAACPGIQLTCYCIQCQNTSTDKCIEINYGNIISHNPIIIS